MMTDAEKLYVKSLEIAMGEPTVKCMKNQLDAGIRVTHKSYVPPSWAKITGADITGAVALE